MTYRDPSLHIRKSELTTIFNRLKEQGDLTVDKLFEQCKAYSVSSRGIKISDRKVAETMRKISSNKRVDADLFTDLLHKHRISLRHRGITKIIAGHRDWALLKEVSSHSLSFSSEFDLPIRKGMIEYIKIGCSKMNKFNVAKFINLYEIICETYLADREIEKDSEPNLTEKLYGIYSNRILNQTGIFEDIKSDSTKYVYFVRARQQAKQLNISLEDYMEAQFEGLDFAKGIPHPTQLSGPKANERLYKYLFKNGLTLKK